MTTAVSKEVKWNTTRKAQHSKSYMVSMLNEAEAVGKDLKKDGGSLDGEEGRCLLKERKRRGCLKRE